MQLSWLQGKVTALDSEVQELRAQVRVLQGVSLRNAELQARLQAQESPEATLPWVRIAVQLPSIVFDGTEGQTRS